MDSVSRSTVVDGTRHTVSSAFIFTVVAELPLFETAGIGPVSPLLFLLEIAALCHTGESDHTEHTLTNIC